MGGGLGENLLHPSRWQSLFEKKKKGSLSSRLPRPWGTTTWEASPVAQYLSPCLSRLPLVEPLHRVTCLSYVPYDGSRNG